MNYCKRIFSLVCLLFLTLSISAQSAKKYPSRFWEITGNGLTKPSYLYGTMHVSKKLAYYLPDTFFIALKNVDKRWQKHHRAAYRGPVELRPASRRARNLPLGQDRHGEVGPGDPRRFAKQGAHARVRAA